MLDCDCLFHVFTDGFQICTECGLQTTVLETHILAFNETPNPTVKPYRRENRLKRLFGSVFGFTKVCPEDIESVVQLIPRLAEKPIAETYKPLVKLVAKDFPHLKRKICSIYRQAGFPFKTVPEYNSIKSAFRVLDESGIQSFNYLLHYVVYGASRKLFQEYRPFIKPQTRRLSRKNDSTFISFLQDEPLYSHLIPIVGFEKLPTN
jgi:hypothetical protein